MSDATSYLVGQMAKLKAAVDAIASWRWATVTSVDPLRVTPDGDTSPLAEAPDTLVAGLSEGDRVRLVIVARRALILGRAGGAPSTAQHGTFTNNVVEASGAGTAAVVFPKAFQSVPDVQVTSGDTRLVVEVRDVTTTGFNIGWRNVTSSATTGTRTHLWRAEA